MPHDPFHALCSCVLVAEQTVLTAAHCFEPQNGNGLWPERTTVRFADVYSLARQRVDAVYIDGDIIFGASGDLALVQLDQPIYDRVADLVPMVVAPAWRIPAAGETVTLVGYGRTGGDCSGPQHKQQLTLPISVVNASYVEFHDSTKHACKGDSGGPAINALGEVVAFTSKTERIFGGLVNHGNPIMTGVEKSFYARVEPSWSEMHLDDHGANLSEATELSLPASRKATFSLPQDIHYFVVEAPAAGALTITTKGGVDTFGELWDADHNRLARDNDSGLAANFRIDRSISAAGPYYVVVKKFTNTDPDTVYTLEVGYRPDDHVPSSPTPVALATVTAGSIESPGDTDYLTFTLNQSKQITITTTGNTDTVGGAVGRRLRSPTSRESAPDHRPLSDGTTATLTSAEKKSASSAKFMGDRRLG